MAKFAVDGSALVVQFSFREATIARYRTLRIPLSLVDSVSADPLPLETLNQGVRKHPIPEVANRISEAATGGGGTYWSWTWTPGVIRLVGPSGAQVFTNVKPRRPALRVDLREAAPYIGFLVTYRNPFAAAADLRAAIFG
jgi:hypothetical protein